MNPYCRAGQLFILLLLTSAAGSHAQPYRHEAYASYGLMPVQGIGPEIFLIFFGSTVRPDVVGPVGFGYRYFLGKTVALGAEVHYTKVTNTYSSGFIFNQGETIHHYTTLLPRIDFTYVRGQKYQVYSGLGVGVSLEHATFENADDRRARLAWQLTAVGVRVGQAIGGFTEVGVGYNGLVRVGISGKF
ncbi:hypothetical protein [Hymenobacter algoricola]|uniref:Outer membrane protein beta-barrel domain-containing protein n=1 Tax=Hymenobacter algoricola TaxID=486267 RepID=A0ABP7NEG0_9BACT